MSQYFKKPLGFSFGHSVKGKSYVSDALCWMAVGREEMKSRPRITSEVWSLWIRVTPLSNVNFSLANSLCTLKKSQRLNITIKNSSQTR
jgi:hypothetical protein